MLDDLDKNLKRATYVVNAAILVVVLSIVVMLWRAFH
jgi:hypothetical protein